jgi:hypothetical protein
MTRLIDALKVIAIQRHIAWWFDMPALCPICSTEFTSFIRLAFHYLETDHGAQVTRIVQMMPDMEAAPDAFMKGVHSSWDAELQKLDADLKEAESWLKCSGSFQ